MFPTLTESEIARIERFGTLRHYERGARLFAAGEPGPGMFIVLKGKVIISQRDGLGKVMPIVRQGRGQFLTEVAQLSGRNALVDGDAEEDVETIPLPPERLRAAQSVRERARAVLGMLEFRRHQNMVDVALRAQWTWQGSPNSGTQPREATCRPLRLHHVAPSGECRGAWPPRSGRGRPRASGAPSPP